MTVNSPKEARKMASSKAAATRRLHQDWSEHPSIDDLREYFPLPDDRLELMLALIKANGDVALVEDRDMLPWPPYAKNGLLSDDHKHALRPKLSMLATGRKGDGMTANQKLSLQQAEALLILRSNV